MIPFLQISGNPESKAGGVLLFDTYRASPRPLRNSPPYLNATFMAEVSPLKMRDGMIIKRCRLAFGAYGTKHAIRPRKVEEIMTGKVLTPSLLTEAIEAVRATIIPVDGIAHLDYLVSLATGYLFKFFGPLLDYPYQVPNGHLDGCINFSSEEENRKNRVGHRSPTLLSSSHQIVEANKEYYPVGKLIKKSEAAIQASGDAGYVDDILAPPNCLYGAFVYSTKPLAHIKGITSSSKLAPGSVTALVSFKDIPDSGENIGLLTMFDGETLFANKLTRCAGECVAFVTFLGSGFSKARGHGCRICHYRV